MIQPGLIRFAQVAFGCIRQFPKSCWLWPGTPPSRCCWIPSSLTRLLISSPTMKPFEVPVCVTKASMLHSLFGTALHRSRVGFLCLGQWLLSLDDQMASCQSRGVVIERDMILKVKEAMTGSWSFSCHAHGVGIYSGCAWINLCGLTANKQTALVQPGSWSFNHGRAMRTCSVSRRPWLQEITWCSWQIIRQKPIHRWERNGKLGKESKVFRHVQTLK